MSDKKKRTIVNFDGGFFHDLSNQVKLILRLMADPRVNPIIKVLPIGSLLYFILFPDLAPGPIDDALVVGIGLYLFVELCPPEVVKEHREALENVVPGEWRNPEAGDKDIDEEDIIEGEFREE
ncbi:MAG: hypothetical protein PVG14_10830 [Anaerolineales bacterium]|jgi:hypothetical protein